MSNRRTFMMQLGLGSTILLANKSFAQTPMVAETEPQAVALGYKADTSKVDTKKYPKHVPTQACKNCMLYQAKPTDVAGPCVLFAGKHVAANGWCSAYAAKA
ncbi:MAG: high-potential iron-sulfur protein [Massilia sp.]|nr:high-potential iron-sulfur protein [Massilia sp.]